MQKLLIVALLAVVAAVAVAGRAHNDFFDSLTEQQKTDVGKIMNSGKTKKEIKAELHKWVATQPKDIQSRFAEAERQHHERKQLVMSKHAKLVENASPEGQELDAKIRQLYKDQTLTKEETCRRVNELIDSTTEEIRAELKLKHRDC